MAKKSFNEVLKRQEEQEKLRASKHDANTGMADNNAIALDDTERVKVLSPARLVFKRFIRNKLAIVGTIILLTMFVFAFLGPLVYPHKQTETFNKYDKLIKDYAIAGERTEYAAFTANPDIDVHYSVKNKINSYIKEMTVAGETTKVVTDDDGNAYTLAKAGDNIYTLSSSAKEKVAVIAVSEKIAEFSSIVNQFTYEAGAVKDSAMESAAVKAIENNKTEFTSGSDKYTITLTGKKVYDIAKITNSVTHESGKTLPEDFDTELVKSIGEKTMTVGEQSYSIEPTDIENVYDVFAHAGADVAIVSSVYIFDAVDIVNETKDPEVINTQFDNEFKVNALLAIYGEKKFTAGGVDYTVKTDENGEHAIYKNGEMIAEVSNLVIRRYDGTDTLTLAFKEKVAEVVAEIAKKGEREGTLVYPLPERDIVTGEYLRDENGVFKYVDTTLFFKQKLNDYVITCEQTTFQIDRYALPNSEHILGTDGDGMDILARMMYGGRISLLVGFVVVILETILGVIMGGIAGYFGGWVDTLIMRLVDIFNCIPSMPILIILGAFFDELEMTPYERLACLMAVLGILGWSGVARLVRGQILSLREQEFMVATEAVGLKVSRRIFKHLIPNVMPQLIVTATAGLGSVILTESTLSFLGLGVKHPLATWGTMINSVTGSSEDMIMYAYIWIPVGLLICLTVIAFNFVGDGLRDAFDPKMKR